MWQRFTERARRVILLAQEEAGKVNSSHVGTEHLLLGLVRENEGVAAQVLLQTGLSLQLIREEIEDEIDQNAEAASSEPKLTLPAKRVLELAADEARRMKHNYIGSEHLLLALIREKDGVAANVLRKLGLDLEKARQQVLDYLDPIKIPSFLSAEEKEVKGQASWKAILNRNKNLESVDRINRRLSRFLPRELRDMGNQLRNLHKQKEIALLQDDYESAAIFRDEANILEKRMEDFAAVWEEKMNEEEPLSAFHESLRVVVTQLITEIEAMLEAPGDAAKIAEVKERLRSLKNELLGEESGDSDSETSAESV